MVNRFRQGSKRKRQRPARAAPAERRVLELEIARVGARGDGIAHAEGRAVFVPYTAPGDRLTARVETPARGDWRGEIDRLTAPGPGRATAPCAHFGRCGGCSLQHLDGPTVAAQKRDWLAQALAARGLDPGALRDPLAIPPGRRRRARFAARKTARGWIVGFNEAKGARIVDQRHCPALLDELAALPAFLRALLARLERIGEATDILACRTDAGLDLAFFPAMPTEPSLRDREALLAGARDRGLARVAWDSGAGMAETVAAPAPPRLVMGGVSVLVPPGGFLQPSADGEAAIVERVLDAVGPARRVADLYCGLGTLALPLAEGGARIVHAVDGDAAMVDALRRAAGNAGARLTGECRDLARQPLAGADLARFDAAVFDPPRAGAAAQAAALAASGVARVVAVSCNPATLARDLRMLVDGGFRIDWVQPIDQFPWAAHLEAVACLSR